jgi:hypothetical protein
MATNPGIIAHVNVRALGPARHGGAVCVAAACSAACYIRSAAPQECPHNSILISDALCVDCVTLATGADKVASRLHRAFRG